jgi:hypothetical protein
MTGNEVFADRVENVFSDVIQMTLEMFGVAVNYKLMAPDDMDFLRFSSLT